jgi:hypothetical protein
VPSGVYFYIIKPLSTDGKVIEPEKGKLNGSVTLIKEKVDLKVESTGLPEKMTTYQDS